MAHEVITLPHGTFVRNCKGHVPHPSWLVFWREQTKHPRAKINCSKLGCTNDADRGGHIFSREATDTKQKYIIPLCNSDNCWNKKENEDGYQVVKVEAVRAVQ
mgnify:CR=1 FL=1